MRPLGNMAWSLLDVLANVERDVVPVCPAAYRDGPPGEGERQIAILRSGVQAVGQLCATGDRINVDHRLSWGEWPADQVERWPIDRLIPYAKNSRTRVLDDLGRGAMAAVAELSHADILLDALLASDPVPGLRDNASAGARREYPGASSVE
jgi:hypothetical protein